MSDQPALPTHMDAWAFHRYGGPEVLERVELPLPQHGEKDVLVRVHATTVNRTDCGFRSAEYVVSRLFSGLLRPKRPVLGCEFAGEVVAVGTAVTRFKLGDRVFGYNDKQFGGHAQYLAMPAESTLALIPEAWSYIDAAPLTEGSHYAWGNLRAAGVGSGSRVLINGATGAIGSAAVQLAVHFGATVTAVCDTPNLSRIKALGAHEVIDRLTSDFHTLPGPYDLVFDAVGKSRFKHCRHLIAPTGCYISTELGPRGENIFHALFASFHRGPRVRFPIPSISQADVEQIGQWAGAGAFRPVIDRIMDFEEIPAAHRYAESGMKIGNVVIVARSS